MNAARSLCALGAALLLAACGSAPKKSPPPSVGRVEAPTPQSDAGPKRSPYAPAAEDPSKRGDYVAGGLYAPGVKDSVPDAIPDVDAIPEPEVKDEPRSRLGNRDYAVLGKTYRVRDSAEGYVEEGLASYYGRKFHGRLTSNHEVYDMYAFSAAHRTLPLPSFARVTNLANGRSVIVRVNDRGPFHSERIIDLSFAAATKLGFVSQGTARVEVRAITPDEARDSGLPVGRQRGARGREPAAAQRDARPATPVAAPAASRPPAEPALSADEFERWMQAQGIRVATGIAQPATPASSSTPVAAAAPPPTATAAPAESVAGSPAAPVGVAAGYVIQIAAFGTRENAERACDRLREAGIEGVRIDEANVNGQTVWRVRVGPLPEAGVPELSARAADLGFRALQIVRD